MLRALVAFTGHSQNTAARHLAGFKPAVSALAHTKPLCGAILACLLCTPVPQALASDEYVDFLTLQLGQANSATLDLNTGKSLDAASGDVLGIGYGFEENDVRVLIELNQTQANVGSNSELTAHNIMYNAYWAPDFTYDISLLIGGGVGYSQWNLKTPGQKSLKDAGWSAKLSLGGEYNINSRFAVNVFFNQWLTDEIADDAYTAFSVDSYNHSDLVFGAIYRY